MVIGLAGNVGSLNMLSDLMIERGAGFADGEIVDLGGKYPVKIINTSAMAQAEYTVQASNFYGSDDYSVQQVLVPDKDGLFPDDARCDRRYQMPVLARQ